MSVFSLFSPVLSSHVLPLELWVLLHILPYSIELSFLIFLFPELENFRPRLRKFFMLHTLLPPFGNLGESLVLIKEVGPVEGAG